MRVLLPILMNRAGSKRVPMLVVKSHNGDPDGALYKEFGKFVSGQRDNVVWIDQSLSDSRMKNLVRNAGVFVSLHRSEEFRRGLADAMYMGKPVIGSAYSGNLDYMRPGNSLLVDYELIKCQPGDYPFCDGEVWADPQIDHAATLMADVAKSPELVRRLGRQARLDIRRQNSYLAIGLRMIERLENVITLTRTSRPI